MLNIQEFLVKRGLISTEDLEKALHFQNETNDRLCSVLHKMAILPGSELAKAISEYYDLPLVAPEEWPEEPANMAIYSPAFLRNSKLFPIADNPDAITVAIADPGDIFAIDAVRLAAEKSVITKVAPVEDIYAAIERTAPAQGVQTDWLPTETEPYKDDVEHLRDLALGTPLVRLVNELFEDALRSRATDIHIEPFNNKLSLRMRVDGILRDAGSPPPHIARAIASRIKILTGLDIAERRMPQDGRARIHIDGRLLDIRVATMPTIHGEAVSIRLLDNVRRSLDLFKLGFGEADREILQQQLSNPHGMFIVTGPTGSGKTTTLAAALSILNDTHRKILTIEDPIEYEIDGVNQTQAKPEINLTFARAMRSFLRHDPDIIMVGEMRDTETARIGVHAALTGHLVLTTLHTNSAAAAIPRLLDMGVDAYLLASSLNCIVAQRLVRLLCMNCRQSYKGQLHLTDAERKAAGIKRKTATLWKTKGCERCHGTGYRDRIAITEVLTITDKVRSLIKPGVSARDIEVAALENGMSTTLIGDGIRKSCEGLTTIEEVRRVTIDT